MAPTHAVPRALAPAQLAKLAVERSHAVALAQPLVNTPPTGMQSTAQAASGDAPD